MYEQIENPNYTLGSAFLAQSMKNSYGFGSVFLKSCNSSFNLIVLKRFQWFGPEVGGKHQGGRVDGVDAWGGQMGWHRERWRRKKKISGFVSRFED